MHHFVVRQRQHEVLAMRVQRAKGQLVVVVGPVHRIHGQILQRVVHPAHVPLHIEAEAAVFSAMGHAGPGGGLFCDHQCTRHFLMHGIVQRLQPVNGFEILAAAIGIGQPLAGLSRIVAIDHRCDRIDTQPIEVKLLQPVQRAAREKTANLLPRMVEHQCLPVGVFAEARVGVLIQRCAIETRKAMRVLGEVPRHPIQQYADATRMHQIDEGAQVIRAAAATGRRIESECLVAPGAIERMLGDRQ